MTKKMRKSKDDLLHKGLELLSKHGIEKLTIDALCTALSVTKGSFYHHFSGLKGFRTELLEFWMEENTKRFTALADLKGTPVEQYSTILEYAANLPHQQEKAIRAWGMSDTQVAEYLERVDNYRITYLAGLLEKLLAEPKQADMFARVVLSTMVGSRHLFPPVLGDDRNGMMQYLHDLVGIKLLPSPTVYDS